MENKEQPLNKKIIRHQIGYDAIRVEDLKHTLKRLQEKDIEVIKAYIDTWHCEKYPFLTLIKNCIIKELIDNKKEEFGEELLGEKKQ